MALDVIDRILHARRADGITDQMPASVRPAASFARTSSGSGHGFSFACSSIIPADFGTG